MGNNTLNHFERPLSQLQADLLTAASQASILNNLELILVDVGMAFDRIGKNFEALKNTIDEKTDYSEIVRAHYEDLRNGTR